MINKLKRWFALTDTGAKGTLISSIFIFFKYLSYMLPTMLLIYYIDNIDKASYVEYLLWIIVIMFIMYIPTNISYNTTYNETYKEAKNIRINIADTLKSLPLSYFSKHNLSDLSQTIMQDVADIEHALCHSIPEIFGFIPFFILVGIMLLAGNLKLGLAIVLPILLSGFLYLLSKKNQIKETTKYFGRLRENSEIFQETVELQQEIRSYNLDKDTLANVYKAIDDTEQLHIKTEIAQALPLNLASSIIRFSLGATILVGGILYYNKEISLLYLFGYILAATRIIDGVNSLYASIAEVLYIDSRVKRLNELYDTEIQHGDEHDLSDFNIHFKNVSFSYNNDGKVIDKVSFNANQNEVTAIIGPSGCGKTTALRLISRLYDYDEGEILIGNNDIKKLDVEYLFKNISVVFQDVTLFNTSVMENIRIGRKDASDEEVIQAAKNANCDKFINRLPNGYNTLIGENGTKLSGGERQRLSIARAMLKDASIILLDEISASLDVENEMDIQESLNKLIKNKTVIVVSHRLKSVEKADKIVLLDNGKVEAIGKHDELLKNCALYKAMINRSKMIDEYLY